MPLPGRSCVSQSKPRDSERSSIALEKRTARSQPCKLQVLWLLESTTSYLQCLERPISCRSSPFDRHARSAVKEVQKVRTQALPLWRCANRKGGHVQPIGSRLHLHLRSTECNSDLQPGCGMLRYVAVCCSHLICRVSHILTTDEHR